MKPADDLIPVKLYGLRRGTVGFLTVLCGLFAVFTLIPIVWLLINATKNQASIFESFGFWFSKPFQFFHNLYELSQNVDGEGTYLRWMANTALYAGLGGLGSTALSALAGYGFARFAFRGNKVLFYVVICALLVPITAISLPLYLVYAKAGLINSIWGLILPSLVSPISVYLMRVYVAGAVPTELIDAARMDGAGDIRIFLRLVLPLMVPGLLTVFLLSVVAVWNNYFLPLMIFSQTNLYPLTVGMGLWAQRAQNSGGTELAPLVVIGGLITIVPMVVLFLVVQRYWRGGLLLGSIAN
ncbi:MAG TPA: carbohydrate ABC transporter permease [Pseudonocardiaceae bacterium]|jgi:multiple sugar transport system permease protein|nr:carbohydrate ABC transporter permease [Pseudonocardiaceae bacterium]